jgi:glycosyltransferase involved in cell wall biosynthesis
MGPIFVGFRCLGVPVVLECNGVVWREYLLRGYSHWVSRHIRFSAWQQAKSANHIVAVTQEIADEYAHLAARPPRCVTVIPNGVDVDDFRFDDERRQSCRRQRGIDPGAFVVGYVGSFASWHGLPTVAQAAGVLKQRGRSDVAFLLVGEGADSVKVRRYCDEHHLSHVLLPGKTTDRDRLRDHVACFDVGLCTYTSLHGSSLKLFEFMAAGIPIIGSGFPQVVDILRTREAGIVLESAQPEELADAIETIADNRAEWQSVGRRNQRLVEEEYSWSVTARRLEPVFEQLTGSQ